MDKKQKIKNTGILTLFDNRNGNINGDRENNNIPRRASDGKIIVTSNCFKSMIREYMRKTKGKEYIMRKIDTESTPDFEEESNYNIVLNDLKLTEEGIESLTDEELIEKMKNHYIDYRLFGSFVGKESGPFQFYTSKSLNKPNIIKRSGTTVLSSEEGNKTGTFRKDYVVDYALFSCYGIFNLNLSKFTGTKEEDIHVLFDSLKYMFSDCTSRSKHNSNTRLIISLTSKNKNYRFDDLSKKISLKNEDNILSFYDFDCVIIVDQLIDYIKRIKSEIDDIGLYDGFGGKYCYKDIVYKSLSDILEKFDIL